MNNQITGKIKFRKGFLRYDGNFMIFDRWGERVFESTDPSHSWNGWSHIGVLPLGVTVYVVVTYKFTNEQKSVELRYK